MQPALEGDHCCAGARADVGGPRGRGEQGLSAQAARVCAGRAGGHLLLLTLSSHHITLTSAVSQDVYNKITANWDAVYEQSKNEEEKIKAKKAAKEAKE